MKISRIFFLFLFSITLVPFLHAQEKPAVPLEQQELGEYVVLGWNDLGMHCMNGDFEGLAILPPYNVIWAQIVHRGAPPLLVDDGVLLDYRFPYNSESASKVNFWDYEDQLFGVELPDNIGLTGKGMYGTMEYNGTAFEAAGIPLTPFEDDAPTEERPYQLAEVTARDESSGDILDVTTFVAPVSVEMHCDLCHPGEDDDRSILDETSSWKSVVGETSTRQVDPKVVWTAILAKHDDENDTDLLHNTPVLCAECHASNALGTTGNPELKSLSQAIHGRHAEEVSRNLDCYSCHPGDQTQCLRGAMHIAGVVCQDCHGDLREVAQSIGNGRRPWIDEPKCSTCHETHPENANTLYRNSTGHGGMYCTSCHNSPHAELPTVQERDWVQAVRVQGRATYIKDCMVCHTEHPMDPGPHGVLTSWRIVQHLLGKDPALTGVLDDRADYSENGLIDTGDVIAQVNRGL